MNYVWMKKILGHRALEALGSQNHVFVDDPQACPRIAAC